MADQKQAMAVINIHKHLRQVWQFLGMAGFFHIRIPNFGLIVKPLYDPWKELDTEPLKWDAGCLRASETLKETLTSAPAL